MIFGSFTLRDSEVRATEDHGKKFRSRLAELTIAEEGGNQNYFECNIVIQLCL